MNQSDKTVAARIAAITEAYGTGPEAGMPNEDSWARLAAMPPDQPVTLVNFFKLRARAAYPADAHADETDVDGETAFNRYASVSMPALEEAGGRFLLVAPFGETFIGSSEDWDLVAIGTYPGPAALFALFEQPQYRSAYVHRLAACAAQRVSLCMG